MQGLLDDIKKAKRILLISHIFPDGDAVGSLLGLHLALVQQEKVVFSVLHDGVPPVFSFLAHSGIIQKDLPSQKDIDLAIVLDAGDASRTGYTKEIIALGKAGKLAIIDHHPRGDLLRYCHSNLHRVSASSTCELVYEVAKELGAHLTPALSTALLTGLYTDTGGFQYTNTSTTSLDYAAELMKRGAKLHTITREVTHHKSIATLKLLGLALERVKLTWGGICASSVLTYADIQACEATSQDVSGIVGELNVLPGAHFTLLLVELEPGIVRGSLRTGDGYTFNVGMLAKLLGGGGHQRAAGFVIHGVPQLNNETHHYFFSSQKEQLPQT